MSIPVKDLIVAVPGVEDGHWEATCDKETGGNLTVHSELSKTRLLRVVSSHGMNTTLVSIYPKRKVRHGFHRIMILWPRD